MLYLIIEALGTNLWQNFKDIEAIKKATFEELLEVEGMNKTSSESVYNYFRKGC